MQINKRVLWLLGILAGILIIAVSIPFVADYSSYRSVSFKLSDTVSEVTIYGSSYPDEGIRTKITSLDKSSSIRLKPGTYYVAPSGSTVVTDAYEITVDASTNTIDINPYYSESYLSEHFAGEVAGITNAITSKYPSIATAGYTIGEGAFYHFGDWYGATLYKSPDVNGAYDFYGVILHKVEGQWQIAAPPSLLFTYGDYPTIPKDIVFAVNAVVNGF